MVLNSSRTGLSSIDHPQLLTRPFCWLRPALFLFVLSVSFQKSVFFFLSLILTVGACDPIGAQNLSTGSIQRGVLTFVVEKKMINLIYPFFTNSLEIDCIYIR